MTMPAFRALTLLIAGTALAVFAAACGDSEADDGGPPASPTPSLRTADAPIDELELVIRESFPPQYAVRIVSGIPSGCAEFKEAVLTGTSGNTFTIKVANTEIDDPNAVCTAIYGMKESIVELGSDLASGAEYTVQVNDQTLTFTAQ